MLLASLDVGKNPIILEKCCSYSIGF